MKILLESKQSAIPNQGSIHTKGAIVGRLKDNETIIDEKTYNMNQHGFARDFDFNLIEKDQNSLTYKLASTCETKQSAIPNQGSIHTKGAIVLFSVL